MRESPQPPEVQNASDALVTQIRPPKEQTIHVAAPHIHIATTSHWQSENMYIKIVFLTLDKKKRMKEQYITQDIAIKRNVHKRPQSALMS